MVTLVPPPRALIPLFWYVAIALGVPFLNGGYAAESYYRHAGSVLATLGGAGAALALLRRVRTGART